MNEAVSLLPAAAKTLAAWHAMIAKGDLGDLATLMHPDARFRSPFAHKPYDGAAAVVTILQTVSGVFRDFAYLREWTSTNDAALEFRAVVDAKELKGVDLIAFDQVGLIREFEVMVRPATGLQALSARMGPALQAAFAVAGS